MYPPPSAVLARPDVPHFRHRENDVEANSRLRRQKIERPLSCRNPPPRRPFRQRRRSPPMAKIVIVVGSLRAESFNRQLAEALTRLPAAEGHDFSFLE